MGNPAVCPRWLVMINCNHSRPFAADRPLPSPCHASRHTLDQFAIDGVAFLDPGIGLWPDEECAQLRIVGWETNSNTTIKQTPEECTLEWLSGGRKIMRRAGDLDSRRWCKGGSCLYTQRGSGVEGGWPIRATERNFWQSTNPTSTNTTINFVSNKHNKFWGQ